MSLLSVADKILIISKSMSLLLLIEDDALGLLLYALLILKRSQFCFNLKNAIKFKSWSGHGL